MASVGDAGRTLRLHEAFRDAPDDVLRSIGLALTGRGRPGAAEARERVRDFLQRSLPAHPPTPRRRQAARPTSADRAHLERLRTEFDAVNTAHFADSLPHVPLRISGRMRSRNGHFSANPLEIAISRRLCEMGAAGEAECTLRHEMIHLHQYVSGRKPGHGKDFREWAERLGVPPRASRSVCWDD